MVEFRGRKPENTDSYIEQYLKNPLKWVYDIFGVELWDTQGEIFESAFFNRYTGVKSCFGSGKSFLCAALAIAFVHLKPESLVITTAPTFRQTGNIWNNIHVVYEKAKAILGSRLLTRELHCGPNHYAVGFSTDVPENIQGMHAPSVLIIVDESAGVDPAIHSRLGALMTGKDYHRIDIGNPLDPSGHFYNMFSDPKYHKFTISAFDTPNIKAGDEVIPGLVTKEWVDEQRADYGEGSPYWLSNVLGEFPPSAEDQLIPLTWIQNSINLWESTEAKGIESHGLDIGGSGTAETCLASRFGNKILPIKAWKGLEGSQEIISKVKQSVVEGKRLNVDTIGVGYHVAKDLKKANYNVKFVNVQQKSDNPERFINLRSQYYWNIRELLNPENPNNLALPEDDTLTGQLSAIKYEIKDSGGKIQIESKESMRNRGLPSPDRADAVMLACCSKRAGIGSKSVGIGKSSWINETTQGITGGWGFTESSPYIDDF